VMAHELAHVVQQRHEVSRIRRAVGFEFEVGNWTVERIDRSLWWTETSGRTPIPTADVDPYPGTIATAGPWLFTGDQSNDGTTHIEWVMERPVEETDAGRAELVKRMDRLQAENDDLIATRAQAKIVRKHEDKGDMLTQRYRGQHVGLPKNVLVEPWPSLRGEPQLTAGIKLDRLYRVMENMGKTKQPKEAPEDFDRRRKGAAVLMGKGAAEVDMVAGGPPAAFDAFTRTKHPGKDAPQAASKKLIGVLALMRSYLIGGTKKKSYAKGIAPFLAKTDFAKQFSMLPEAAYYQAHPDVWLEVVLASAGLTLADADTPLFEADISYIVQRGMMDELRLLTKRAWIRGIAVSGVDYCTPAGLARTNIKRVADQLFGFGSLGDRTDTVGPTNQETDASVILEYRRMVGGVPHDKWKKFALGLFDYVRRVNAGDEGASYGGWGYYD